MLRYKLNGFESLSLQQKKYIYYLAKATLLGRDIVTDQFGRYNLAIRHLLEAVSNNYAGDKDCADYKAMVVYLKQLWFANGIYHHYACDKFKPEFSETFLRGEIQKLGAKRLPHGITMKQVEEELLPVMFNPDILPKRVNKQSGEDLVKTSACNFYQGVTQKEAEDFYASLADANEQEPPSYGLNSTLVKEDGVVKEQTWTTSTLYGKALTKIVFWLKKAAQVAETDEQKRIIAMLVNYYETGDLKVFDQFSIAWLQAHEGDIDFINGFIEVYGDPLGIKGSWEGLVEYKDKEATKRTQLISQNAQWFEDHSPVDPRFKKAKVKGVSANVICAAMLGGDEYPSSAIGINLPNADWIRAAYGSKSVTIGNLTEAYNKAAQGNGFKEEFVVDEQTIELIKKYGDVCDDLHTDLHECLGHGSGQLLPGTDPNALGAYADTIEEARADLFGLYYIADNKLTVLGLTENSEAYKSQYYTYIMNGLMTQLVRIKPGKQIEEAHMRNRSLIAHWALDHCDPKQPAVEFIKKDGKTYVRVNSYEQLRELFAKLLCEIQRIKSEGDFDAAKHLVETYAIAVDKDLHAEVLERYKRLNIAPYKGFINPWLKPVFDSEGNITDITIDYTEGYTHQMLRYSDEYATL